MTSAGYDGDTAYAFFTVALALLLALMVFGHLVGQPAVLGYVETGSMSPSIEAGDGFIAVPAFLSPGVSVGDVVVYEAEVIEGGGLTTHRVVDETDRGYVTRGDANPFTDQDAGEPPVQREQVKAKALTLGGDPVTVPGVGFVAGTMQGAAAGFAAVVADVFGLGSIEGSKAGGFLLLGVGGALFLYSMKGDRRRRVRLRERTSESLDGRRVTVFVLLAVLLPANIAMVAPSGIHEFETTGEVAAAGDLEPGDSVDREVTAVNEGLVAMLVAVEPATEGVEVSEEDLALGSGETRTLTVSTTVPPEDEVRYDAVSEHRYFLLLPVDTLHGLHNMHPLFALAAVNAVLAGGILGLVGGLFGFGKVRFRDTSRERKRSELMAKLLP